MKKYLLFAFSIVTMIGCSEYHVQELQVGYNTILSDSLNKETLLDKDGFIQFSVQNGDKKCEKTFNLVYYNQERLDTIWHVISTQCIFGDTIIDGIEFDQKEDILDRIYYNSEKANPEYISVDLLEVLTWEHGIYYDVNMYDIDCHGVINYVNRTSKTGREISTLTKVKKYCGTYFSDIPDNHTRLELRDGKIEGSYAMLFQIRDSEGCKQTYSQFDKIIENEVIDLIPDTMTIKLQKELAVLSVKHLEICDTIENLKLNLKKE